MMAVLVVLAASPLRVLGLEELHVLLPLVTNDLRQWMGEREGGE